MQESTPNTNPMHVAKNDEKLLAICGKEEFSRKSRIMGMFVGNASACTKLSSAALFPTVAFLRQVQGLSATDRLQTTIPLLLTWVCFLVAILVGVSYRYFTAKYWNGVLEFQEHTKIRANGLFNIRGLCIPSC